MYKLSELRKEINMIEDAAVRGIDSLSRYEELDLRIKLSKLKMEYIKTRNKMEEAAQIIRRRSCGL